MRFASLRRHWDRLGRRDPYWAALTDPDKHGGRWDVDEFFKSGAAEIDDVLRRAEGLGVAPPRGRALDFGCGAGRLTQAMASQFTQCDGVDISESMLRIARQQNRHADRCLYHVNAAPDLSLFADASFDFAYSTLVLQHMEPRYSSRYIRELVRVLSPAGLLVFQLPSQRSTMDPPANARRTPAQGRLPLDAFRARLTIEPSSLSSDPGQAVSLDVIVENQSPRAWPALPDANGHCQITVANRWLYEDDEVLQRDDGRCPLPHDLPPGGRTNVMLVVTAPETDGAYILELDVVQEDVVWFGDRGSTTLRVPFVVGNGLTQPRRQPKTVASAPPPFRVRHPRVFRVLSATGVRDAYWAARGGSSQDHSRPRARGASRQSRDPASDQLVEARAALSADGNALRPARRRAVNRRRRRRPRRLCGGRVDARLSEQSLLDPQGPRRPRRRSGQGSPTLVTG